VTQFSQKKQKKLIQNEIDYLGTLINIRSGLISKYLRIISDQFFEWNFKLSCNKFKDSINEKIKSEIEQLSEEKKSATKLV
jgi:hypothetical protein